MLLPSAAGPLATRTHGSTDSGRVRNAPNGVDREWRKGKALRLARQPPVSQSGGPLRHLER
eukprot:7094456-Pyramimonas_sp.AAC.1